LSRELPDPPARPHAGWSAVPDLLDLVAELPEPVPTVIVTVDATGAEIHTDEGVRYVEGADRELHQVRGTGLHHWRITRRAEETRRQNIKEVAEAIEAEVARHGATLLVLAEEVQSRARLRAALGGRAAEIAEEVDSGGRAAGSDLGKLDEDVRRLQRARVAERRRAALERLAQAGGHADGLGVEGLPTVLAALRVAQVETLFMDAGVRRDAEVWVGPDPVQVADREQELRDLGVRPLGRVPADAALIRAAAGTGAELMPIGGEAAGLAGRPLGDGLGRSAGKPPGWPAGPWATASARCCAARPAPAEAELDL
jgi:hypothetical protein